MERKVYRMCTRCGEGFRLNHGGESLPPHNCNITPKNGGENGNSTTHTHLHAAGQGVSATGCVGVGQGSGGK